MSYIIKSPDIETKLNTLTSLAEFESLGFDSKYNRKLPVDRFIYSSSAGGKEIDIFKVLQTNFCEGNCLYCANRKNRNTPRYYFKPDELANIFLKFYGQGKVKGLFLSSAIYKSPNYSQAKTLETIRILRKKYDYDGYIHYKILPGADEYFIKEASRLADRLSINLEAVSDKYLCRLSPSKDFKSQLLGGLDKLSLQNKIRPLKSGVTTQLVVGAGGENDKEILKFASQLYKKYNLRRVYYRGFSPVYNTPLENQKECSKLREYRLYQADILIRDYGFKPEEIRYKNGKDLSLNIDPKLAWAKSHPEKFPIEINKASFEELIRVPGIGKKSASKIINLRRLHKIIYPLELKRLRLNTPKMIKFVTFQGKKYNF